MGRPRGSSHPKSAAHGAGTSAALPMITLGIPGSPTMAVIMGGLMIFGLLPGPMLFKEHADFVWGFIGSCWIGNIIGLVVVLAFAPIFAAVLKIRFAIIMPIIVYVCAVGAYAVNNRMIDIYYMIGFGVIGYLFKKLDYPLAPLVLALVLGDMAESALRQSLLISSGNPIVLFAAPDRVADHDRGDHHLLLADHLGYHKEAARQGRTRLRKPYRNHVFTGSWRI